MPTAISAFDQIPEYTWVPSKDDNVNPLQNDRGRERTREMQIENGEFKISRAHVQLESVGAAVPSATVRITPNTQTLQFRKLVTCSMTDEFGLTYTPPRRNTPQTWTFRAVRICNFTTNLTGKARIRMSVITLTTLGPLLIGTEILSSYLKWSLINLR